MKEFKILVSDLLQGERLTSARELHERLGVQTRFNDWFARRADEAMLEEGVDYVQVECKDEFYSNLSKINSDETRGRKAIDYALTDDAVKQICMLEKTEIGREIRKYFISRDKQLTKIESSVAVPSYQIEDPIERAKAWIAEKEEEKLLLAKKDEVIAQKDAKIDADASKVEYAEQTGKGVKDYPLQEGMKRLFNAVKHPRAIINHLVDKKVLFRNRITNRIDRYSADFANVFKNVAVGHYTDNNGEDKIRYEIMVVDSEYSRKRLLKLVGIKACPQGYIDGVVSKRKIENAIKRITESKSLFDEDYYDKPF